MLLHVPGVLTRRTDRARASPARGSGLGRRARHRRPQSARAKQNMQLAHDAPEAREIGDTILGGAAAQPAVHGRRAAAESLSAAVQSLLGR